MPKQKRARERPKKNWNEGIRKAINERNLNEGQWKDRNQWSLGVGQRRNTFWNRYIYIYINFGMSARWWKIRGMCSWLVQTKIKYCEENKRHGNLAYGIPTASCSVNSGIKSYRIMPSVVPNFTRPLFPIQWLEMAHCLCHKHSWSLWLTRVLVLILDLFSEHPDGFLGRWRHFVGLCCFCGVYESSCH